jgi:hypothetical protein
LGQNDGRIAYFVLTVFLLKLKNKQIHRNSVPKAFFDTLLINIPQKLHL